MADAAYDAVIIGGGAKGLVTAMYLAKYGGMEVAIFERKHEAGGGWCTDEGAAPGFLGDYHAHDVRPHYHLATERDFPEWKEEYQIGYVIPPIGSGAIFEEDQTCIVAYNIYTDPTQERTARSIAKFSQRDAETWAGRVMEMFNIFQPVFLEWVYNPPSPPGELDVIDRLMTNPEFGFDPSWTVKTLLQVLRDLFESDALIAMILRNALAGGRPPDMPGYAVLQLMWALGLTMQETVVSGGTHSWAHAAVKIFLAHGGKIITEHEVDKVLIENGTATGVRLTDGTEVKARKLVVSTLDPYSLCFRLIGKEYIDGRTLRRVEHLERWLECITWYTWALHERPDYKAASFNPDINGADFVNLISKDPEATVRDTALRKAGIMPDKLQLKLHGVEDKLRMPEGKHCQLTEAHALPATALSEREWLEFKKSHAEGVIKHWQEFAPNMTWGNVIGYMAITPYDIARGLPNMGPQGNVVVIDNIPSQMGKFRPIPELARHKTPIKNLYATGSAWHPIGSGVSWQGYNCYKVIAQDFGLRKPWEGQPW